MSGRRTTKDSVGYIANKFAENPGHFAATVLQMYWDMEKQRDQYKAERDTLIDDIAVLKANNDRYRKRAENAMEYAERSQCEVLRLERENEKLKATNENLNNRVRNLNLNGQIQHDELMSCDGEVRYWKDKYTTLTNHIRTKAENNPGVSRYIDLVNYIDRLEQK
ncbi:MAG: hypothetical protein ABC378_00120 [Staphylococcus pseudoxylosus]|uniref:hypothetical protein n=1 Tax=Staphylococcus pseudoxylosus TaxID=2282419 RepID=UPI0031F6B898